MIRRKDAKEKGVLIVSVIEKFKGNFLGCHLQNAGYHEDGLIN